MSTQIVECVPNFSEGRDQSTIGAIAEAMQSVNGVSVLDVDPGVDTNRTVYTFVGAPDAVLDAAFAGIRVGVERIDMRKHRGEHARIGAVDVTPFVPVAGISMEKCVELARKLGERVANEFGVPVYLYEEAATCEQRRNLSVIRAGEYEGLAAKLEDPEWKPDFGPAIFNPRLGAFVIGARKFLIAYNVNLNTRDAKLANDIALQIRERGRLLRDANGNRIIGEDGVPLRSEGRLKECKAMGWYIGSYGQAQVSMNLTDYHVTSMHAALEAVRDEAQKRGLIVTGSELVGLIPKDAILESGRYYLKLQGRSWGVPENELIDTAVMSMGLSQLSTFDPRKKIIEMCVDNVDSRLVRYTVAGFVDECSRDTPAPGGGSVAALSGALGASLVCMVANLTVGKSGYEDVWDLMKEVAAEAQSLKDFFLLAVDRDSDAFKTVMAGYGMPKGTLEQKTARIEAIAKATKSATLVPFEVLQAIPRAMELAISVASKGNKNSVSDAGVAASSLRTAAEGAWLNVRINLAGLDDSEFRGKLLEEGHALLRTVNERLEEARRMVDVSIGS